MAIEDWKLQRLFYWSPAPDFVVSLMNMAATAGPEKDAETEDKSKASKPGETAEHIDEQINRQVNRIEKEVARGCPLIGDLEEVIYLQDEYMAEDAVYQKKLQDLSTRYSHVRRTRGDGNCFYRSFAFGCAELFLRDKEILARFKTVADKCKAELIDLGYSSYTIEDFHETFMEILEMAEKDATVEEMLAALRDQEFSDYFLVYLRLLVSNYLQHNADFFSAFIEGERTIKDFCCQEVEPMAKESDHIHIIALTSATDITVRVEYMDRGGNETVNHHDFPDDGRPRQIFLLYRPGHYDLLYPLSPTGQNS